MSRLWSSRMYSRQTRIFMQFKYWFPQLANRDLRCLFSHLPHEQTQAISCIFVDAAKSSCYVVVNKRLHCFANVRFTYLRVAVFRQRLLSRRDYTSELLWYRSFCSLGRTARPCNCCSLWHSELRRGRWGLRYLAKLFEYTLNCYAVTFSFDFLTSSFYANCGADTKYSLSSLKALMQVSRKFSKTSASKYTSVVKLSPM